MNELLRSLPSVEKLLAAPEIEALESAFSHDSVVALVRDKLGEVRTEILAGAPRPDDADILARIIGTASSTLTSWPNRVINATGVIIHTNLGRAPLSDAAAEAAKQASIGYTDLEISLDSGKRGSRYSHISDLLSRVTGAEAGIVVNNNAAAVMLVLAALGSGKEVVVSRGEAVEIGGGFRIPDVLLQSGCKLVEVGTTNRTYARDFENAVTPNTAAFLKVHASNFKVMGFTSEPGIDEIAEVGLRHGIPLLHDLGSGALLDTTVYGLAPEPMVQQSIANGTSLAMFSGDKLLGGPQSGIIVGKSDLVAQVGRHPLMRALRVEKSTLASLSESLLPYLRGTATSEIPVWQMIAATEDSIRDRAVNWQKNLRKVKISSEIEDARSAIGGGSLPGESLPSVTLSIKPPASPDRFLAEMRSSDPPVIARIENDTVKFDPRTVLPGEDDALLTAIKSAFKELKN
ncbi:MAG: L-seryl-tRNA(Sec) selenium transferase [Chloroflexi bacterium]|nr:L-seryl-tRNA(Sec) selenium transferase [Chloroflexota bacterium]